MTPAIGKIGITVFVLTVVCGSAASGQATAPQRPAEPAVAEVPQLRVQIVVSRSRPGSDTSNLPFELMIPADGRSVTSLNMGVDVPVPSGQGSYSYRRVGNNITCQGARLVNGVTTLSLSIEDSSIHDSAGAATATPGSSLAKLSAAGPMFRSFQTDTTLAMREGETVQFTLATDKQTGETLKVSVTATRVR